MPEVLALIPLIAGITGIAGTGVGLGLELSNQPGKPATQPPSPAVTDANAQQAAMQQKALVSQQMPGLQAQTSGSLSPDAYLQLAQLITGTAGAPGSTVSAGSTGTSPATTGLTSSTFG